MTTMQNIPSGYHISKGATNDFYILNDGESFIRNLSKNLSEAKSKAVQLIKKNDPDYFKDGNELTVNIWNRFEWKIEKKPKWIPFHDDHIDTHNRYFAKIKKEKAIEEAKAKYSFVGEVGDILDLELTITEIFGFDGDYGFCMVHKFKDADDNSLIYFGNSKQLNTEYDSKFKVGDKITVTATIKRHTKSEKDVTWTDGFDSVLKPVTVITRPKINKQKND
nr:hypothetical protein [uncultured Mediterranean phage uvMED]